MEVTPRNVWINIVSWQTCKKKIPVSVCGRCQTGMQNRKHQAVLENLMTNVDMDCRAFAFSSSFFFFICNVLFTYTLPSNAGNPREGNLAQVSNFVPRRAGDPYGPRKGEEKIGTGVLSVPWPLMRQKIRVKEAKESKVVEERNPKRSRGTSA